MKRSFDFSGSSDGDEVHMDLKLDGYTHVEALGYFISMSDTLRRRIAEKNDNNGGIPE